MNNGHTALTTCVVPVYAAGVLISFNQVLLLFNRNKQRLKRTLFNRTRQCNIHIFKIIIFVNRNKQGLKRTLFNRTRQCNIHIFNRIIFVNRNKQGLKRTLFNRTRQCNIQIFSRIIFVVTCYPVCGMVHIKEPLRLIGKSI